MEARMQAAPLRFLGAAFWPVTIWTSVARFRDHPADDYVERTFPIVATAIAFWLCVAALLWFNFNAGAGVISSDEGDVAVRLSRRSSTQALDLLWLFMPVIYIVGFWLFTAREERFPSKH